MVEACLYISIAVISLNTKLCDVRDSTQDVGLK